MTDEFEGELIQLQNVISQPFTPQIGTWVHGITVSFTINGLAELIIGFIDDKPDWQTYNPHVITKATVTQLENAVSQWMKNVRTNVYQKARAAAFTTVIREELIERTCKPPFDSTVPPLPVHIQP